MNETLFVRPVFSAACKMKASLRGTRKRRTVAFRHKDVACRGPDRRLPPLGQETKIFAETALGEPAAISRVHDRSDHGWEDGEAIRCDRCEVEKAGN